MLLRTGRPVVGEEPEPSQSAMLLERTAPVVEEEPTVRIVKFGSPGWSMLITNYIVKSYLANNKFFNNELEAIKTNFVFA